ncbi:MAG: hypothetical protein ACLP01_20140 [Solirubrobacteraceae bacterium]
MDAWGWTALGPWLSQRATLPVGPLFCVIADPLPGHAWWGAKRRRTPASSATCCSCSLAAPAYQLRHAHAVELLREGIPLPLIQRQLTF